MEETESRVVTVADPIFRIILHTSPTSDLGVTHWTEAPECPAASDGGRSVDEAVERTEEIIRAWWQRRTGQPSDRIQFVLLQGD